MDLHWHAFRFTGNERPADRLARDPDSATPPNEIAMFFRKPASMRAGTFTDPDAAYGWLAEELAAVPPLPAAVPMGTHLDAAADCLRRGADAYVGYYATGGRFLVRALLVCPRAGERCPAPPG